MFGRWLLGAATVVLVGVGCGKGALDDVAKAFSRSTDDTRILLQRSAPKVVGDAEDAAKVLKPKLNAAPTWRRKVDTAWSDLNQFDKDTNRAASSITTGTACDVLREHSLSGAMPSADRIAVLADARIRQWPVDAVTAALGPYSRVLAVRAQAAAVAVGQDPVAAKSESWTVWTLTCLLAGQDTVEPPA